MLKQEEKRRVLKPFVLSYAGEGTAPAGKKVELKGSQVSLQEKLKVINRVMERVKRI